MLLKYLTSIILLSLCVTAFVMVYMDVATTYGVDIDQNYSAYNQTDNLKSFSSDMRDKVDANSAGNVDDTDDDKSGNLIIGAFNSIQMVWDSWGTVNAMATETQDTFKLPTIIYTSFVAILFLFLAFAIIRGIFKFNV